MKLLIDNLNEVYGENVRLIKNLMKRESLEEYPDQLKWSLQLLYLSEGEWVEVCRIDNYPHGNEQGSHIHDSRKGEVKRVKMTFQEAEKIIWEIGTRKIEKRFHERISDEKR